MAQWWRDYRLETLGEWKGDDSLADGREHMRREVAGDTWVAHDTNELVAMSRFNARVADAVQVGGVYTPSALRERGFARCAVAGSLVEGRAEGVDRAILFTGDDAVAARKC